ncbi:DUF2752 domain-containing protein [Crocinitomix algicola]|uniref:DUF2752 domain-containing protein n=1 Tax=Crocinitomix algicola TaxID=1740263 RepID=UPI00083515BC
MTLFLLPANFFDSGVSLCPSKQFLNMECLGCGLTRGVQHAIHFEFNLAWEYNKLTFIILPILIFYWLHLFLWVVYDYNLYGVCKSFVIKK